MKTFWIRTASASVYALLFIGSIYSGRLIGNEGIGVAILTLFSIFVAEGCTFEYYRMASNMGFKPNRPVGYALVGLIALTLGLSTNDPASAIVSVALLLIATPLLFLLQLWRNSERPASDTIHTLIPLFYFAIPMGLMPVLHDLFNILMMCIIMVWVNDSFAYIGGSLLGKHKMWPKHSPGKTWEGTAIGVIACVLVGVFAGPLFHNDFFNSTITWIVLGLVCGIFGTLGDLVESMLKRACGIKDSGSILPGHGGFLDRFDSLLMIIPFAFLVALFTILA